MAQQILHRAESRGHDHLEWLNSRKTFSFADYYNPKRMGFGVLRVLNDDILAGGKGFGSHPHDNMEIVSILLDGSLQHEDNAGNKRVTTVGQAQVMSTGSGIFHSEYNYSASIPAEFLQIWIYPDVLNATPTYTQIELPPTLLENTLYEFIKPGHDTSAVAVREDTWFSMGTFEKGVLADYKMHLDGNGVYAFVVSGAFLIDGNELTPRDGLGVWDTGAIGIKSLADASTLLLIEVPMKIN